MTENSHRDLLQRAAAAIEGIDRTLERQEKAFERQQKAFDRQEEAFERQGKAFEEMMRRSKVEEARAEARHQQLLERSRRSEAIFIEAMSEIDASLKRNTERLDDMGEAIRANTAAVLSVLDRLNPGTA